MNKGLVVVLALPAILGIVWIATKRGSEGQAISRPAVPLASAEVTSAAPIEPAPAPQKKENVPASPKGSVAVPTTIELMDTKDLQALLEKDPAEALKVARRDLAKDPTGPDAAERNWVIVKSLAVSGHYEDARREAEVMVPKFRDTRWANDIERHILAHP